MSSHGFKSVVRDGLVYPKHQQQHRLCYRPTNVCALLTRIHIHATKIALSEASRRPLKCSVRNRPCASLSRRRTRRVQFNQAWACAWRVPFRHSRDYRVEARDTLFHRVSNILRIQITQFSRHGLRYLHTVLCTSSSPRYEGLRTNTFDRNTSRERTRRQHGQGLPHPQPTNQTPPARGTVRRLQ